MRMFDRRTVLKGMLIGATGAALRLHAQWRVPGAGRARLAVASYPFRAFLDAPNNHDRDKSKPGMDLKGFAKVIKQEFGLSGMEPLDSHFISIEPDYVRELRAAFDAAGVRVVNIPIDAEADLCSPDAEKREQGYRLSRKWIDTAVILGAPSVRLHMPKYPDVNNLSVPVAAFSKVVRYAAEHNVIVDLENDDPRLENARRIVSFIETMNDSNLYALPDFANGLMGGDEAFNAKSVETMFRRAKNIAHVKDAEFIDGKLQHVDLKQLFGFARAVNFQGYYSMESDSNVDPFEDTKHLIERSLALM